MNLGNGQKLFKYITPLLEHEVLVRQRLDLAWRDVEYLGRASEWYRKFKRGMALAALARNSEPAEVILFRCFCYYQAMRDIEVKTVYEMVRWWESFDAEAIRKTKRDKKNAEMREKRALAAIERFERKAALKLADIDRVIKKNKGSALKPKKLEPWEQRLLEREQQVLNDMRKYK